MKRHLVLAAAILALLAAGCSSGSRWEPFAGGLSPAEARNAMQEDGFDCVLLMNTDDCQHVVQGWTDSLHFASYTIDGGKRIDVTNHTTPHRLADQGWRFMRLDDGRWALQYGKLSLAKVSDVHVSVYGVEFQVSVCGVPVAKCTFVTDRPELSSTDLMDCAEVQELLLCAIVEVLLDANLDDGTV